MVSQFYCNLCPRKITYLQVNSNANCYEAGDKIWANVPPPTPNMQLQTPKSHQVQNPTKPPLPGKHASKEEKAEWAEKGHFLVQRATESIYKGGREVRAGLCRRPALPQPETDAASLCSAQTLF